MSALIPAFARSRGRVDPAVFGHVIRLVQQRSASTDTVSLVAHARTVLSQSAHKPLAGPSGLSPHARHRSYSASAQAVVEEHYEPPYSPMRPEAVAGPSRPRSCRSITRRQRLTPPAWANLPPSLAKALADESITTPSQFSTEFERFQCKSGQLADTDTLQSVFRMYLRSAEPSQWAWLSGQLGHMLAAVADAGEETFHPDVAHLGNTMRAYCLAELQQVDEASGILSSRDSDHQGLAVEHAIWSLALRRMGDADGALGQMVKVTRRGVTRECGPLTPTLVDCFALYAQQASDHDMLYLLRKSGYPLRRLLLDHSRQQRHPAFVQVWHDWLADLSVSLAVSETSAHGRFVRRHLMDQLVRDPSRASDALELFEHMHRAGEVKDLSSKTASALVRCLVQGGLEQEGQTVLEMLRTVLNLDQAGWSGLLRLHTQEAEDEGTKAESVWQAMEANGASPTESDRLAIAWIRAAKGDLAGVKAAFDNDLPDEGDAADRQRRLRVLLRASIAARDVDAATDYMLSIAPTRSGTSDLSSVLRMAVRSSESNRAPAVLDAFIKAGHTPDCQAYTILITYHGHRREYELAEQLHRDMEQRGIELDTVAWSALLNAHVEAGNWNGAAERWSALPVEHRNAPSVLSVMMKAMVLKGSAITQVLDMFRSVETPTTYLWALVLQSASDNDDLGLMERLFVEMEARAKEAPQLDEHDAKHVAQTEAVEPDVYVFSIMLHAYLKAHRPERSRAVYDEMLRRDIIPSSVTYGMIISSYASGKGSQSLKRAQDFAMSIYRMSSSLTDIKPKGSKASAQENILSPLISAAGRADRPYDATKYFELLKQDAEPSIPLYTRYLDVWRRASEPNMVMRVWTELFALACRTISFSPSTKSTSSRQRQRQPDNALVIPLSIVLITLGKDRRLPDIRRVWDEVRSAGFGFDAANFNHLAVSLGQSGDVEGAFEIVENVLLDPVDSSEDIGMDAAAPVASSRPKDEDATDTMFRPPNRRDESIAAYSSADGLHSMTIADHLSAPLPGTEVWRPYNQTVITLDSLISQLEAGQDRRAWMGLATTEEDESADGGNGESGDIVPLPEYGTCVRDPVDGQPKKTSARGLLMKLNRKYSKAMALVMFHRRKQAVRRRQIAK